MKRAFTIIELLTVIAIIAILATIIVIAASGSIKSARANRRDAMRVALEQAIVAYHAQDPNGEWPGAIETKAQNSDDEICTFTASETDEIFQKVIGKGFGKSSGARSMLIDASALFVADASKLKNGSNVAGIDFTTAANRNSKHHISFSSMAFGYQNPSNGKFCRFGIEYNTKSDSVTVK